MKSKHQIRKWLWYFSLLAAVAILYKTYTSLDGVLGLVDKIIDIFAPFVGGFVLAFFLFRPCNWLEKRFLSLNGKAWPKLARPLALAAVYLVFLGLVSLVFYLVIPILVESLTGLFDSIPKLLTDTYNNIQSWIAPDGLLGGLKLQDNVDEIYAHLTDTFTKLITTENVMSAVKSVGGFATSLVNVVIAFVVSIYMLHGREHLTCALRRFVGLFVRPRPLALLGQYTRRTGTIFAQYIYGALLDATVVGVVVSIGLAIFGVPYAVLLGMLLGVFNLVPYFGAIVGCVGISFVALLTNGLPTAIGVAIFIVVAQQVDANIIQPRIVGDSVGLRPFYVLLGITFFGGLFGFWGILLGPPLMAVLQMVVRDVYDRRREKKASETTPDEKTE